MKKNENWDWDILCHPLKKLVLMAKLTAFFLLVGLLHVSASSFSQSVKLSISVENKTILELFEQIENISDYRFFYDNELNGLNDKTSVNCLEKPLSDILNEVFTGKNIAYEMKDRLILIKAKEFQLNNSQQTKSVSGKVTDDSGASLPGVTVVIEGTTSGTITDFDGRYNLTNVSANATLQFSFVGMKTVEVLVGNQSVIDVMMTEETVGLEEVVAIGYGVVKKSDLTGSVSSLTQDDFNAGAHSSMDELVLGKSAGVQVVQSSAEPGGAMSIRIRGAGSVNAGSEPLYVIDGLPIDNSPIVTGTGAEIVDTRTPRNPLSTINPSDIQSIEVLKDASATAIYGARGANGVILITTKRGDSNKLRVTYSGYTGIQSAAGKLDLLKPQEYMEVINDILAEGGGNSEEAVTGIQGDGTDWQDEVLRQANISSHSLSISGGSEKSSFYTSLNYFNQEGIVVSSGIERYDIRANLEQHLTDKFTSGLNITTSYTHNDFVSHGYAINEGAGALYAAINFDPTISIYNEDGTFQKSPYISIDNPIALLTGENAFDDVYRTLGTVYGEYAILPEWKVKLNLGGDIESVRRDAYVGTETKTGEGQGGVATIITGFQTNYLIEATTTYTKDFLKDHHLTALAGVTKQNFLTNNATMNARGFSSQLTKTFSMQSANNELYTESSFKNGYSLLSYLGRINYNYKGKYYLTASFRADGSSRFGAENKYGYFPSTALKWKLSQEDFMKNLLVFSDLSLRASWGKTGNQAIGNYQSLLTFGPGPNATMDQSLISTYDPSRIPNLDLKWETTEQIDIGLDFGFISNRIYGSLDYYRKETTDMLLNLPISPSTGFGSILKNIGSIRNSGFDFGLTSKNLTGEFKWTTSLNCSTLKNEVLDIGDIPEIIGIGAGWSNQITITKPGETLRSFYGYEILGVWQEGDDFSVTTDPVQPGDQKYADTNGDGAVNADDKVILGNSFPKFSWGLTNSFSYKGFELSCFFEGVEGIKMFNANLVDTYFPINLRRNKYAPAYLNRWTASNPSNVYPSFVNPNGQGDKSVNSYTVEDASYIRLKYVKLSYTVPATWLRFIQGASIYVTGQNLATWTDYSGFNPATNSNGGPSVKIDYNSYPVARAFILGAEITF